MNTSQVKVGQQVKSSGYEGTIVEVCTGKLLGMVVVRLGRTGTICIGISSLDK